MSWRLTTLGKEKRKAAINIKTLGWTYWRGYWKRIYRTKNGPMEVKFECPLQVCAFLRGETSEPTPNPQGEQGT